MAKTEIITQNSEETERAGEILAAEILRGEIVAPLVIGLMGDLGSGKTTFARGFAKGLGVKDKITSPTFVIFKKYLFSAGNLYHVDCYRIKDAKDLAELDFSETLKLKENVILIEWAEKIKDILPKDTIWMNFKYLDENKRKITA
ncbi:tRNA (adenosine(37)-N6)-threonylcarbamoyltransferase complex ATPase subunit type 1 TsaE [Patescibacteria group bacterium]|nr:tRNA (adenosine(37)-N6)-threonylcarbamoyltransferase complex ATPase subunit type 1 TsaE [Patescibacteria group bacterium]